MWDIIILPSALYYSRSEFHTNALKKIVKIRMYVSIFMSFQLIVSILFLTSKSICSIEAYLIMFWALFLLPIDVLFFRFMSTYRVTFEYIFGGIVMFLINIFTFIIALLSPSQQENCAVGRLVTRVYMLVYYLLVPTITSFIVISVSNQQFYENSNVSNQQINRRNVKISNLSTNRQLTQEECSICLSPLEGEISTISCKHSFHTECLNSWFKRSEKTCPLCRSNI